MTAIVRRLLGRPGVVSEYLQGSLEVRCDGLIFSVRSGTDDLLLSALSADPLHLTRRFRPKSGDVVIDVGANVGGYALRAALVARSVIAIEPEPSNYAQLVRNIRVNRLTNITALLVALSDQSGVGALRLASHSGRHSLEGLGAGEATGDTVRVQLLTLDEIVDSAQIERIDWLKIDVEGHELSVLRGGPRALTVTEQLMLEFDIARFGEVSEILVTGGLETVWHDGRSEQSMLLARRSHR
jgi:FkbM family methyltransferase